MFTTPWACKITEHIFLLKNGIIRDPESGLKQNNTRDRDWKKFMCRDRAGLGLKTHPVLNTGSDQGSVQSYRIGIIGPDRIISLFFIPIPYNKNTG